MRRALKLAGVAAIAAALLAFVYGLTGWWAARHDMPATKSRAQSLLAQGRGPSALGPRLSALIAVQDPAFFTHSGVDFTTPGAGATTITQSLAKRLGFREFRPGLRKIRQTGYALGLESGLEKEEILALFLDTVPMGDTPEGWTKGVFAAASALYQVELRDFAQLPRADYLRLVAVMIAPGQFDLMAPDPALDTRVARIERLLAGDCAPLDHGDVWLLGCAAAP